MDIRFEVGEKVLYRRRGHWQEIPVVAVNPDRTRAWVRINNKPVELQAGSATLRFCVQRGEARIYLDGIVCLENP